MRNKTHRHYLIAFIAIQIACASFTHGFEQGSYFVFDLFESAEAKPIKGRLAVLAETMVISDSEADASEEVERSEFEIDFKQAIQAKSSAASSAFEFDMKTKEEPIAETTSFGTETFDFRTSNTVFGE